MYDECNIKHKIAKWLEKGIGDNLFIREAF